MLETFCTLLIGFLNLPYFWRISYENCLYAHALFTTRSFSNIMGMYDHIIGLNILGIYDASKNPDRFVLYYHGHGAQVGGNLLLFSHRRLDFKQTLENFSSLFLSLGCCKGVSYGASRVLFPFPWKTFSVLG